MILKFIDDTLDGNSWEELCDSCYRMRYQKEHYQKVDAVQGGDGGIEGYTKTGVVYQCYCPEKKYSDDDLYKHLRSKMTKDINKLLDERYIKKLKSIGVKLIKEWHFVIPENKDPRILAHGVNKCKEVLSAKESNPTLYDFISEDFDIIIKVAADFRVEFTRLVRDTLSNTKLNLAVSQAYKLDWDECDSIKVKNIERKVKTILESTDGYDDEIFRDLVDFYLDAYMKGIEILKELRTSFPEIYEDLYKLEQAYKREVKQRCLLKARGQLNTELFQDIMNDFEKKLNDSFSNYLSTASISELKIDLVGTWLADCSLQFR